jgi:hypothetical protein
MWAFLVHVLVHASTYLQYYQVVLLDHIIDSVTCQHKVCTCSALAKKPKDSPPGRIRKPKCLYIGAKSY